MARKGFTLIELLVVIAIIAILAAILFPVFARARAKAQQSNCLSNTKQIALANAMYMSDNDQKVIYWIRAWELVNGVWATQQEARLMPYSKNQQMFACPSSSNNNPLNGNDYHINMCALSGGPRDPVNGVRNGNNPVKDSEMNAVSVMIGFDGVWQDEQWATPGYASHDGDNGPTTGYRVSDRHNGGANVSFYDGHSKWMQLQKVWSDNAGNPIPLGSSGNIDASNRTIVGPNPWWTGSNES
ncbi:MAG TPA: prepilin-type N-terminal cleavage/methylation domain-containing protein [Armatimonadota bacterium]|jgi:prepilin-type N-terminal cleavage/methylation domain-containing protein/prepilin-type processing-associated H-X9-DG protein